MLVFTPVALTSTALVFDNCSVVLRRNLLDSALSAELTLYRGLEVAKAHEVFHRGRQWLLQVLAWHVELKRLQSTAILVG